MPSDAPGGLLLPATALHHRSRDAGRACLTGIAWRKSTSTAASLHSARGHVDRVAHRLPVDRRRVSFIDDPNAHAVAAAPAAAAAACATTPSSAAVAAVQRAKWRIHAVDHATDATRSAAPAGCTNAAIAAIAAGRGDNAHPVKDRPFGRSFTQPHKHPDGGPPTLSTRRAGRSASTTSATATASAGPVLALALCAPNHGDASAGTSTTTSTAMRPIQAIRATRTTDGARLEVQIET